jgi:Zn-dependent M28 family amino/carboxypeptidase
MNVPNPIPASRRALAVALIVAASALCTFAQSKPNTESKLIDSKALLADVEKLSADDMEGRSPELPSIRKAREYVNERFQQSGLTPFRTSFKQEFAIKRRKPADTLAGVNFVGYIKGTKYPEKYIVVSAHYDHVGIKKGQIYNGADDNASGTAALFAMAKAFRKSPPKHTLIFVAFDAEELGLQGSQYFVANLPVKKESVLLDVNMDMVSRNVKGELYASGAFSYPELRPILEEAQKTAKVKLMLGHDDPKLGKDDWTNQSDQGPFNAAKIPFVYFGVEDHPDYHKPTDDFANIMPEFYVRAVETILNTVRLLDRKFDNH